MTYKYTLKAILIAALFVFAPFMAHCQSKGLGLTTVVIDPGHGGKDPGALGQTSSTHEKHIVLAVSKLLGEKIKEALCRYRPCTRAEHRYRGEPAERWC